VSWVGGAEWFGGRVGPMAEDSRRSEGVIDCRIDPMSDHWPLLVAEPLDGERLVNSQLRPRAGASVIGRHDFSAARQAMSNACPIEHARETNSVARLSRPQARDVPWAGAGASETTSEPRVPLE